MISYELLRVMRYLDIKCTGARLHPEGRELVAWYCNGYAFIINHMQLLGK